ncbi:hypothetical protein B9Z55_015363 [Caenorhabditis nigoni]|uniref:Domain of unknown function WSN domain-containing protein n=1 Tax=Caenorhabditis nigoni TaxID=1611254 RepID=A0A2G5UAM0_9PELO|nr:hypothetical protein B9Z55_015363 [Caenorhabditis nigoni]
MPNGFDLWENEKTHVQNLGNNGAVLAEKLSEIPKGLPLFEKFADDLPSLSPSGIVKKIESYPEKYQIIAEVKIRLGELEGLTPELDKVKSHSEKTKINDLFASTSTWFENSGANRIFNCLENTTVIGALGNVSWAQSKFVLSELKPDNKYVQDFKESEKSVQSKIDEWEKLSNNIKMQIRNQRSAENRPKLKNPFLVNRDLSYAVKLFHDLVAADNMDYSALTNSEIEIDAIIRNMTDRALRSNLITLFDSDTRKTLRSLPSIIAEIEKKIGKVPSDKEGVSNAFKNIKMEGLSDVKIGELTDMLMLAGLPLNQNVTEEIKYTELEFSNGSTKLANGLKAFLLAHTFLSAVLSPEDKAAIDSQDSSGYNFQWWHAVVAVLGAVVITILIRFIHFCVKNKGEKERFKKALTDTFTFNQKKKDIEIVELASVKWLK